MTDTLLRTAQAADAAAIASILNHYVEHSTSTFLTAPVSVEERRAWIERRAPEHTLWVAEAGGEVVGWAALAEHKPRGGYRHTVENSIYLRPDHVGRGLGSRLLARALDDAQRSGFHVIVAGACAEQAASIRLHEKHGYEQVGRLREVGRKFERWLDVVYLQRHLSTP